MDRTSVLMHQVMLGDQNRLAAYDRAISEVIQPGDVVADLGAGTLILSWLALKHGASHVYALEGDTPTANMAKAIAHRNGLQDMITVLNADARTAQLPTRVDLVLGEMMGNLGPEEDMAGIFTSFAQHNLAHGGRVLPERLRTQLTLIEFANEGWGVWREDFLGLDLSVVQEHIEQHSQVHFFTDQPKLLSDPIDLLDQKFVTASDNRGAEQQLVLPCTVDGTAQAIVGYFTAHLSSSVSLSNFPSQAGSNWGVWIWPLPHTRVRVGDAVEAKLHTPQSWRDVGTWRLSCRLNRGES